jgi:RES domain-containing protein
VRLVTFRWADYDTPLWVNPNRGAGRWNRPGSAPTQYWALHPLGPWAEYARANEIREPDELERIASRTWAAAFDIEENIIANVDFDGAAGWGISPEDLVSDDHTQCQDLSDRLRANYVAIVAPSAALPGTANLVVYGPHVAAPYGVTPVDRDLDVEVGITAEHARPPISVLPYVRYKGDEHTGLEAWKAGDVLPTPDPL